MVVWLQVTSAARALTVTSTRACAVASPGGRGCSPRRWISSEKLGYHYNNRNFLVPCPWSWLLFQLCTYFTDADVCIGHVASNQVVTVRRRYNLIMKWNLKRKYLGRFKWEPFKFLFCESFSSFSSFHEPQDNFEWPSKSFKIFHSTGGASRFFALFISLKRKFNVQLSNWTFHFHHIHN